MRQSDREYFCCHCIHIKHLAIACVVITAITHLAASIFFLSFQLWWAFLPLAITILAHVVMAGAIYRSYYYLAIVYSYYQLLFIVAMCGVIGWFIAIEINPHSSFIYYNCEYMLSSCVSNTRKLAGIYVGCFVALILVNLVLARVTRSFVHFLHDERHRIRRDVAPPMQSPTGPSQPPAQLYSGSSGGSGGGNIAVIHPVPAPVPSSPTYPSNTLNVPGAYSSPGGAYPSPGGAYPGSTPYPGTGYQNVPGVYPDIGPNVVLPVPIPEIPAPATEFSPPVGPTTSSPTAPMPSPTMPRQPQPYQQAFEPPPPYEGGQGSAYQPYPETKQPGVYP